MKIILWIVFLASFASSVYGFFIKSTGNYMLANKYIGIGVAIFFFLWMPLFLIHRYSGKKLTDYQAADYTKDTSD